MYEFDVLFLDVTSPKYYDNHVLEKYGMGGTEASCIRIAEGLAGFGLKVCVVECQGEYFPPMISKHAFYFHGDDLSKLKCKHFIQLRGIKNSHLFPKAKKYLWLHDEVDDRVKDWMDIIRDNNIQVIGVSKWHKKEIEKRLLWSKIDYIYNPIPDEAYIPEGLELKYNRDNFVWAASAHKGLGKGLEIFARIREKLPKANLIIMNPGYLTLDSASLQLIPGVVVYGAVNYRTLWSIFQQSLCVFYPSQYNETFCLILAEANANGVPMLGYNRQVLKEVVGTDNQLVEDGNESEIVNRAVDWNLNGRPKVVGREDFKLSRVIFKWIQLLGS